MNALEKINVFLGIYFEVFKNLKKGLLYLPFLIYAFFQIILIFKLYFFNLPIFSWLFFPLYKFLWGDYLLHYPDYFVFFPKIFSRFNLGMNGFIGIVFNGAAIFLFASFFRGEKAYLLAGIKNSFSKYGWLFLGWLMETAILVVVIYFPSKSFSSFAGSFSTEFLFDFLLLVGGVIFSSLFAYMQAGIILDHKKVFPAIFQSFSIFKKNFFTTFFFVLWPNLLVLPFNFLNRRSPYLIGKFNPELVVYLQIFSVIVALFTSFFLVGTITRFYLWQQGER